MAGIIQGIGGLLFGDAGKNNFEPDPYLQSKHKIDPRAFQLQSDTSAYAKEALDRSTNLANNAPQLGLRNNTVQVSGFNPQAYGGERLNTAGFNQQMQGANQRAQNESSARRQQASDLGLLRGAASGNAPSVAEQQLQTGAEQAIKAQQAAANSARGGAGARAAATRQAAFQGADTMTQANQQAAALRAGEMAQARQDLMAGGQALRAGDINAQGMQLQAAQTAMAPELAQANLSQQAAMQGQNLSTQAGMQQQALQTQAGMQTNQLQTQTDIANLQAALQNRGMNNQYTLGLMGQLSDLEKAQLGANMGQEQLLTQAGLGYGAQSLDAWKAEQNLRAGVAAQSSQADLMTGTAGLGFIGGLASSYIGAS